MHNIAYLLFSSLSSPSACVSPSDPTLTVDNVSEVMREVGNRERVWGLVLGVPWYKRTELMQQSSTDGEKARAVSQYWINSSPDATWKKLTWSLYFNREERAAEMAKQYLPKGMCIS